MGKSPSHPCRHPRTAVSASAEISGTSIVYSCKKCSKVWVEDEPKLEVFDVPMHELQEVLTAANETGDNSSGGTDPAV